MMKNLMNYIKTFFLEEKGGESVEWVVVVGVLLVGIVAVLVLINTEAVRILNLILGFMQAV